MNGYLAIDCDEYLCTNSICALISVWLNTFQRHEHNVGLMRLMRVECQLTRASDHTVCCLRPDLYPYVFPPSAVEDCETAAEARG